MKRRLLFLLMLFCRVASAQVDPAPAGQFVRQYAAHYRVSPELVAALIDVESRWNPQAVSVKGAMGLMQLMPATARRFGAIEPFDAEQNIAAGTRYVTVLMWEFHGDLRLVVAAYYAGDHGVLLQLRAADKREVIAASLIAQLWNGRVSDRIEIERRTRQFNQLVEAHNADVERSLSQKPGFSQQDADAAGSLTRSVRNLADGKGISPVEAEKIEASAPDAATASLQQDNLLLQRRVEALQNSEQNLKQRLNQTTVLLDQERRRNATLKGA